MSEIVKTNPGSPLCDTVIQVSISVKYIHCILYRPVQVFEFQINEDCVGALLPVFLLAVHNSSIGDLVTRSVSHSLTHSTFTFDITE